MTREQANAIVAQAKERGIAFVEDDFVDTEQGEVYNPLVDKPNAEAWLLDTLMPL